jgi:feruloyl-CoA synthase
MSNSTLRTGLRMAASEVRVRQTPDGVLYVNSPQQLHTPTRAVGDWLVKWANEQPGSVFLAERLPSGEWQKLTYGDALQAVRSVGTGLLQAGASLQNPVAILSGNSINHAIVALAAMHVGVPVAPISPAYSLMDKSYGKLRQIFSELQPAVIFAENQKLFAPALLAIGRAATSIEQLRTPASEEVDQAFKGLTPDTVAKILFTSGSTDMPKGVLNTQRMLTVNQLQSALVWPFLTDEPPVLVDWLPWNHTFGGNYTFNIVLCHGGTMYIDQGKPMPGAFDQTLKNLREMSPTIYFNVPRGFELLLPHLEEDVAFRKHFFTKCRFVLYAGASLPVNVWQRLEKLGQEECDGQLVLASSWGSTETAPMCMGSHAGNTTLGTVGLPVPGCELKLVPNAGKLEARVRGPNITRGYLNAPEASSKAFDEEGFYCMGDALRFVDPLEPSKGMIFDGRVAEDFKLRTGTWVHVGKVRLSLLDAAAPLIQDAVITGQDRDEIGAMLFLNPAVAKDMSEVTIRQRVQSALVKLTNSEDSTSSMRVARALVLAEPPSVEHGEITDKGYLNQRLIRDRRSDCVDWLHQQPAHPEVITC